MADENISGTGTYDYTVSGGDTLKIDVHAAEDNNYTGNVLRVNIADYNSTKQPFTLIIYNSSYGQNMAGLCAIYYNGVTVISDNNSYSGANGVNYDYVSKWQNIKVWIEIQGNPFNLTSGNMPKAISYLPQNSTGTGANTDTQTATFGNITAACFLAGSMISTPSGEVRIEDILIGDEVLTHDWRNEKVVAQKVTWVGKAHSNASVDKPDDDAGYPIRILKNALSEGVPHKDMLITSEHSLFFVDHFVPARMLVNGRSIYYDKTITSYDYYHVETAQHSVISADGVLTESYLDTGNRQSFQQPGPIVCISFNPKTWAEDAVAPLITSAQVIEPLYHKLAKRAQDAGIAQKEASVELTRDPDLHLVTNQGAIIHQARSNGAQIMFMIPANVDSVRIVSRASRPCDTIGPFIDDRRMLGVKIGRISFVSANNVYDIISQKHLEKQDGWYSTEDNHAQWTNGNAFLPLEQNAGLTVGMLSLQILAAGPYVISEEKNNKSEIVA